MNRFILLCVSVVVSRSPALARGEAEDTLASLVVQGHAGLSPRVRACKNKTQEPKKKLWVQGLLSYFGPSAWNAVDYLQVHEYRHRQCSWNRNDHEQLLTRKGEKPYEKECRKLARENAAIDPVHLVLSWLSFFLQKPLQ